MRFYIVLLEKIAIFAKNGQMSKFWTSCPKKVAQTPAHAISYSPGAG